MGNILVSLQEFKDWITGETQKRRDMEILLCQYKEDVEPEEYIYFDDGKEKLYTVDTDNDYLDSEIR